VGLKRTPLRPGTKQLARKTPLKAVSAPRRARGKRRPDEHKTSGELRKEADLWFSRWVRLVRTNNDTGMCACVTCGKERPPKEMQAGHFFKRSKLNTRYDRLNVWPQCPSCNVHGNGEYAAYAIFMLDAVGEAGMRELKERAESPSRFRAADYIELRDMYKGLANSLDWRWW